MTSLNPNGDNSEWGWELEDEGAANSVDDENHNNHSESVNYAQAKTEGAINSKDHQHATGSLHKPPSIKNFFGPDKGNQQLKKGITSSPSFQELERAIGATLASTSHDELTELVRNGQYPNSPQGNYANSVAQHKMLQQRNRQMQQYQQQYMAPMPFPYTPPSQESSKAELNMFTKEAESRAIMLFYSPNIPQATIRDACQKFGVLYYIRPEFHNRGATFLCYFDLRSAIRAKASLVEQLGEDADASVHYSIQLHASNSSSEEFRLVVSHIPDSHSESDVQAIFLRYGQIKSFERAIGNEGKSSDKAEDKLTTYTVEFFNIQDARLAASELSASSNQVWGENASITFAQLDERKQILCKNLLTTLSKWRSELANAYSMASSSSPRYMQMVGQPNYGVVSPDPGALTLSNYLLPGNFVPSQMSVPVPVQMMYTYPTQPSQMFQSTSTQSTYVAQNRPLNPPSAPPPYIAYDNSNGRIQPSIGIPAADMTEPQAVNSYPYMYQQQARGNIPIAYTRNENNSSYVATGGQAAPNQTMQPSAHKYHQQPTTNLSPSTTSKYKNAYGNAQGSYGVSQSTYVSADTRPQHHSGGHGQRNRAPRGVPGVNGHLTHGVYVSQNSPDAVDPEFALDVDKILDGTETRTTVMVRNIPNKYNQQMLLEEVNVNHEGTYDFFYLPIDFKNKCNVGYCFINFLEPKNIIPFLREFNGARWKNFNSEKVCIVSFARIQGKAAMVSRFQNSSLLEKDDEYQPLLFYSTGPDRGKLEPFPINRNRQPKSPVLPAVGQGDESAAFESKQYLAPRNVTEQLSASPSTSEPVASYTQTQPPMFPSSEN